MSNGAERNTERTVAVAFLQNDHQRLQNELKTLLQRKQELETAIVAQRGAIAYVEMVLRRTSDQAETRLAEPSEP